MSIPIEERAYWESVRNRLACQLLAGSVAGNPMPDRLRVSTTEAHQQQALERANEFTRLLQRNPLR